MFSAHTREWLSGDVAIADGLIAGIGSYEGGERIDARGQLARARLHRRAHARRVLQAHPGAVRPRGAPARDDRDRLRPARGRQRARLRRRALDARRLRGPAADGVRDGAVVRAGERVRVAAARADGRRHGGDPAPAAGAGRGRDDELPGRHRGRSGGAGEARGARRLARRRARAGRARAARWTPTPRRASAPTTRRPRPRRRWRSAGAGCGCCCARPPTRATCATCCRWCASTGRSSAPSAPTTASRTCCCARATSTRCAGSRSPRASPVEDVLVMATLNAAQAHRLDGFGAIAPGFRADLVRARRPRGVPPVARARRRPRRRPRRRRRAVRRSRRRPPTCSAPSAARRSPRPTSRWRPTARCA